MRAAAGSSGWRRGDEGDSGHCRVPHGADARRVERARVDIAGVLGRVLLSASRREVEARSSPGALPVGALRGEARADRSARFADRSSNRAGVSVHRAVDVRRGALVAPALRAAGPVRTEPHRLRAYELQAVPVTAAPVVNCARCKKRLRDGHWVYSATTRNRYCIDIDACGRRAKRAANSKKRSVTT